MFVQSGCGHCHEYRKRFDPIADKLCRGKKIPVELGDIARSRNAQMMADKYRVRATPTTIGITKRGRTIRLEGAVPDADIMKMFEQVLVIS